MPMKPSRWSFDHFGIRLIFCCWVLGIFYIFGIIIPYQICDLQIFFPILWLALVALGGAQFVLKFSWNPIYTYIFFFLLLLMILLVTSKKSLSNSMLWSFCLLFSCKTFIVLGLTFRTLIHFELNFICRIRVQLQFSACGYSVFPALLVERLSFLHWMILAPCRKHLAIYVKV